MVRRKITLAFDFFYMMITRIGITLNRKEFIPGNRMSVLWLRILCWRRGTWV